MTHDIGHNFGLQHDTKIMSCPPTCRPNCIRIPYFSSPYRVRDMSRCRTCTRVTRKNTANNRAALLQSSATIKAFYKPDVGPVEINLGQPYLCWMAKAVPALSSCTIRVYLQPTTRSTNQPQYGNFSFCSVRME